VKPQSAGKLVAVKRSIKAAPAVPETRRMNHISTPRPIRLSASEAARPVVTELPNRVPAAP
jgi:hypothetical protein